MVRIVGVDLPNDKHVEIGLTYVYGIGRLLSQKVLSEAGVPLNTRVKDLSEKDVVAIRDILRTYRIEGDLRKDLSMSIKRLQDIGAYRGIRHRKGLPARGQRTKTNARTRRGRRKTVGVGKKKEEAAPAKA